MKIKRFGMMGLLACLLCCVAQDASAFYNSQTGRWLSRDPIEEEKGGINLHCAMGNNPANAVDASGLYLAAIDGTDSEKYVEHMQRNSFALNFYRDFTAPGRAGYWNGPSLFGGGVLQTVQDVYSHVCGALRANPTEDINLIGHSRGGLIAILVAKMLEQRPCTCGKSEIKFMGLYDAVGMYFWANGDVIPKNVDYVAHARRNPSVHSRWAWGNTGTSGGKQYVEQFFWVTHSGAGGDPWGGDHPVLYGHPTITEDQDKAGSPQVDGWLRDKARQNGIGGI